MNKERSSDDEFVDYLESLASEGSREALAALRRGLGKELGESVEALRYLAPFLGGGSRERPRCLIATLFAHHPKRPTQTPQRENLGRTLSRLRPDVAGLETRFAALLASDAEDLGSHLRRIVPLLKSRDIDIDWRTLLADVVRWEHAPARVRRDWERGFWGDRQSFSKSE